MTAAFRPRYSITEYLRIESMSREVKHEYVSGAIFAMAGGSIEHAALAAAFSGMLFSRLRGGPCRPYTSDLGIRIEAADVLTYADLSVVCDPIERDREAPQHVRNPRVVIEVLSPSTELYDREQKRLYYQALDSLREYVLVAQDRRRVEVWALTADGWSHSVHDAGSRAPLTSLDYQLDVDELYATAGVNVR